MGWVATTGGRRRLGRIRAAQAALTVLVVAGTALGALLLRPEASLFAGGRGPLGDNPVLVVGFALMSFLGGLVLREKYLKQVGARQELNPVERRLADGVGRVLLAVPLVLPVLLLVLHRFGSFDGGGERDQRPFPLPTDQPTALSSPPPTSPPRLGDHSPDFPVTRILFGLGIALLAVAAVIAGVYLWRHLTRPPAPGSRATYAVLDDEQVRLAQAVDSGRQALLDEADARAAVIACYAAMVESLAGSGTARRISDSPQDLLERAVAGGVPAKAAVAELTALFREARYSTHPMGGGHRDRAEAALTEITDGLRSRAAGPEAVAGTA